MRPTFIFFFFFFNDTATTEIYTLSLHDALPISGGVSNAVAGACERFALRARMLLSGKCQVAESIASRTSYSAAKDRKSTRLNSSHLVISYAVFCLKKKKK